MAVGLAFAPSGITVGEAPPPPPFSPEDIVGLSAWYDFSDVSTLFTDTARTTAVSADGDSIKGVTDKSGGGHHLSEATNPPTYKENILNGEDVARFDNSDDDLASAAFGADLAQPNSVFIVGKTANFASGSGAFLLDGVTIGTRVIVYSYLSNFYLEAGSGIALGASDANWHVLSVLFNGASSQGWEDGAAGSAGNAGSQAIHGVTLGNSYNLTTPVNGDIAAVLIYNAALSTDDRRLVEAYLGTKYGITVV